MKHLVIAGILVALVTALLIGALGNVRLLPDVASAQAGPIDALFGQQFVVIAFLFALIVVLMVYSIVVFRRKEGDDSDAPHILGNNKLEVVWTVVPLLTVLYFAYAGGRSLGETVKAAPSPVEVDVIGSQWTWRFEYPRYGITTNELVLPVDEQALLHLSSTDVIHSFWVPEFRVKQDALPGGEEFVRDLRVTPTEEGEYLMMCAELCGLQHAYMNSKVRVVSRADFDAWTAELSAAGNQDPVSRGKQYAEQYGCLSCHSVDGAELVGPSWKGLYGAERPLQDGTTVTAGDAYLQEAILDPGAHVVQGYPNVMPSTYQDQMSAEQIADVIEFIESLK